MRETVAGATFSFGIASFFQINVATLELIAQRLIERLAGARRVVDLYCGVGTFSIVLELSVQVTWAFQLTSGDGSRAVTAVVGRRALAPRPATSNLSASTSRSTPRRARQA